MNSHSQEHAQVFNQWIKAIKAIKCKLPKLLNYGEEASFVIDPFSNSKEAARIVKECVICEIDNKAQRAQTRDEVAILQVRLQFAIDIITSYLLQIETQSPDDYMGEVGVHASGTELKSFGEAFMFITLTLWEERRDEWMMALACPDTIGRHCLNLIRTNWNK